jgi:hypothetical protein
MTHQSSRRARILHVRAVEYKVAAARDGAARTALAKLTNMADRLATLRADLHFEHGIHRGSHIQSVFELSHRLSDTAALLANRVSNAQRKCERHGHVRNLARQREDSARRLFQKSARDAALLQEQRAAANHRFPRKRKIGAPDV